MADMAGHLGPAATGGDQPNTIAFPFPLPRPPEGEVLKLRIDRKKLSAAVGKRSRSRRSS